MTEVVHQSHVMVAVRSRPLFPSEVKKNHSNILQYVPENPNVLLALDKGFSFDQVYNTSSSQKEVFESVLPIIQRAWEGYHASIIAYGQTGTGKTYTMGTSVSKSQQQGNQFREGDGIIPRAVKRIFELAETEKAVSVSVSFLEVWNEEVYDLLACVPTKLKVIGFKVHGLTEVEVASEAEALSKLDEGIKGRSFCATQANSCSSRSHAIFTLHIKHLGVCSKLHLVDLAGSESVKKTKNEGVAFLEGIKINKGLLALGQVVSTLSHAKGKNTHIPYRDSTLTSVLQESLNGSSYVLFIACISPSSADALETINTLRFLQRAKEIKNQPSINKYLEEYKLHNIENLCKVIPPTPAQWKSSIFNLKSGIFTPKQQRTPLKVTNYTLPSGIPRVMPMHSLDSLDEDDSFSKSKLKAFSTHEDIFRCSSSLSMINSEQDVNELVENIISSKMKELHLQTEVMISRKIKENEKLMEQKIEDTLLKMNIPSECSTPQTLQSSVEKTVPRRSPRLSLNVLHEEHPRSRKPLSLFEPAFFPDDVGTIDRGRRSTLKPKNTDVNIHLVWSPDDSMNQNCAEVRRSPRLLSSTKKALDENMQCLDLSIYNSTLDGTKITQRQRKTRKSARLSLRNHRVLPRSQQEDSNESQAYSTDMEKENVWISKPRKSMRLNATTENFLNFNSLNSKSAEVASPQDIFGKEPAKKLRRSMRISMVPTSVEHLSYNAVEEEPRRNPRRSVRKSTLPTTLEHPVGEELERLQEQSKSKHRRSSISQNICVQPLERKLIYLSPSDSKSQKKHNEWILNFINKENLRGLQQLPTIGPKTAFMIFNYRKLKGQFKRLENLKDVPGLTLAYFDRFCKANNVQ